ncbi:MAG: aminomethyl-transferring glycine dehydrogenase subunit GcvPB [Lentisphaeraceae bacterium]|nr:aminomethyl-transferring glycine dehydrogenase subunit GcvPB [Lentisphaeraceae bacterium]
MTAYNPFITSREAAKHYISASDQDIQEMLSALGLEKLDDLYSHIPADAKFNGEIDMPTAKGYQQIIDELSAMAAKNKLKTSFIGDGLKVMKNAEVMEDILGIRELTTSYTPYQPERSQGTLMTHWIYQSLLAQLTGFEAINASMYERSTALFEALKCSVKISRSKKNKVLVLSSIFPGDKEVLDTQSIETSLEIIWVEDPSFLTSGKVSVDAVRAAAKSHESDIAGIAFPQTNSLGNLEDVDGITNFTHEIGAMAIAIIDPAQIATGGLKPPSEYGENGADMFVAEGQHLAIGPNYGGPGLGMFGIRFNQSCKNNIRSTAGRYVGDAVDSKGRKCKVIVLSTREQHIKREKANSNICSNQAYIATVCGAALLNRGEEGLKDAVEKARQFSVEAASKLTSFPGVELAFPNTPFFDEFTLKLPCSVKELLTAGQEEELQIGIDVSARIASTADNFIKLTFNETHTSEDLEKLYGVFEKKFGLPAAAGAVIPAIEMDALRTEAADMPGFSAEEIRAYYKNLGQQNISPDNSIYPLGSCTMKYNPYLNDYCAAFDGFANSHPQAPEEDVQGNLELMWLTQEYFKAITGLPAVTTQPVAGAQGELVGIKLFQAYHRDKGDFNRNIILIPNSAHGTNPATATVAGLENKIVDGVRYGIVGVEAAECGEIDLEQVKSLVNEYGNRILGVMVTNPNTSGIFETRFREMADLIHSVGGLVYMDGANMNAIAAWVDLDKLGVDAVHNNTHKTWSIPHGGGGPGDAFVAVSEKLIPFLPGVQVVKNGDTFSAVKTEKCIGSFHRHHGNFGHKVRCMTYLMALGSDGIKRMSAIAVLSARYLFSRLKNRFECLPAGNKIDKVMHEFILTLSPQLFAKIEAAGVPKSLVISRVGKLFLDFGFHAPTVAFPEVYGLMVEPTESYTKAELDRFADAVLTMLDLIEEKPEVLLTVPHFTPIDRVEETAANKAPVLSEKITELPEILENRKEPETLWKMPLNDIKAAIVEAHFQALNN